MTREEIIRNLKYTMEKHKNDTVSTFGTNISVMCKDILDYLEQEHCEDCISRKEVIKSIKELFEMGDCYCDVHSIIGTINQMPSIQPKPKTCHCTNCGVKDAK